MSKTNKIRRYRRKDYTSVVEFPVEIIGRDGMVRRYSFEESIRLYERRIASADIRYTDRELVLAEKNHCKFRIDQLRRSFFAHHGWPAVEIVDELGGPPGILAAEVAAFLRRALAAVSAVPERFSFSLLERADTHRVYFVQPPNDGRVADSPIDGHFLLYVFPFALGETTVVREAFFDMVKVLDGVRITGGRSVESMVAFFHTHDCGLILTGSGKLSQRLALGATESDASEDLPWGASEPPADRVEEGMRMLSAGRLDDALRAFTDAYAEQHFRRVAYLGAAVVADQLGLDDEVETATVMGCRYFPGDAALEFHRGLNQMRRQRFKAALATFGRLGEWRNGRHAVALMVCLSLLGDRQYRLGRSALRRLNPRAFKLDPHLESIIRWTRAQQWARDLILGAGVGIAALGAAAVVSGLSWWGLVPAVGGVVLARMVMASWHRQLIAQLCGDPAHRMRLSSSAVLMDDPNHV